MVLVIALFLLQFIAFNSEVEAQVQNYQFLLIDNFIDLELFKPIVLTEKLPDSNSQNIQEKNILSFKYQLSENKNLPLDLPLFLVAFNKDVVFYTDASVADGFQHEIQLDLKKYFQDEDDWHLPVFYQNQYLKDLDLKLSDFNFVENLSLSPVLSATIEDLDVIEEIDKSLTVIFSLIEENRRPHSYELFCLDETSQRDIGSKKLIVSDGFLWGGFNFANLFSNIKKELIFHLSDFACDGLFYVLLDGQIKSEAVGVTELKDL